MLRRGGRGARGLRGVHGGGREAVRHHPHRAEHRREHVLRNQEDRCRRHVGERVLLGQPGGGQASRRPAVRAGRRNGQDGRLPEDPEKNRVCSYDRLGEGASDQPEDPQSFESTGEVLTAVLDRVAGDNPVVLTGHSLGGVIAARYAPDHQDRVRGLVLLDATSPTPTR
ncbi:alpha/beta fold hydrolase [Streptomyces sp. TRM 70361]|uniref:alpha/beta fold hydrolase n=1 Tax=Streptomyces sp. TRM 70361 TaxID=3116553 RepID=UPI003FCEBADB